MATFNSPQSYLKTVGGLELDPPTYTAPSAGDYVIGGYHDFDGADEEITFGSISSLEFDGSDTFTISLWAYKDTFTTGSVLFSYDYGTGGAGNGEGWIINWTSTSVLFLTRDGSNINLGSFNAPTLNAWHHILIVFSAGGFSAYVNGAAEGTSLSGTLFNNIAYTNVTDARIGTHQSGNYFPGYIAEVAVWNSDQSANVTAIYNSRARHDLMDLTTPPDVFYAPLTSYGDNPDGTTDGVFEAVAGNDGTGVNMEAADAVSATVTEVTSTLTKALNVSSSVVTTTKVEDVVTGVTGGTGMGFP